MSHHHFYPHTHLKSFLPPDSIHPVHGYTDIDYYSVLNVSRHATQSDIRHSYLQLAHYHPDKSINHQSNIFLHIHNAYTILSNRFMRYYYDMYGAVGIDAYKYIHSKYSVELYTIDYINEQVAKHVALLKQQQQQDRNGTIIHSVRCSNTIYAYKLLHVFPSDQLATPLSLFELIGQKLPQSRSLQLYNQSITHTVQYQWNPVHTMTLMYTITRNTYNTDCSRFITSYNYEVSKRCVLDSSIALQGSASHKYCQLASTLSYKLSQYNSLYNTIQYNWNTHRFQLNQKITRLFKSSNRGQDASSGSLDYTLNDQLQLQSVTIHGSTPVQLINCDISSNVTVDSADITINTKLSRTIDRYRCKHTKLQIYYSVTCRLDHDKPLHHSSAQLAHQPGQLNDLRYNMSCGVSYKYYKHSFDISINCTASNISTSFTYKHQYFVCSLPVHLYRTKQNTYNKWIGASLVPLILITVYKLTNALYKLYNINHKHKHMLQHCTYQGRRIIQQHQHALHTQCTLRRLARRIAQNEWNQPDGLQLLYAQYYFDHKYSDELFHNSIDVLIPLNALIRKSQLILSTPYYTIPGIYGQSYHNDADTYNESYLHIVYMYHNKLYKAISNESHNTTVVLPDTVNHILLSGKDRIDELRRIELYNLKYSDELNY